MSQSYIRYNIYVVLGRLKKEGRKKIEIRELMNEIGINSKCLDSVFFIVSVVKEMGYEVSINGK